MLLKAAARGVVAGLAGAAVMTAGELVEQRVTGRPASYVPARALLGLLGRRPPETARPTGWNLAMHYGTAGALGALRGIWAEIGLRGPTWSAAHAVVRFCTDQTVENATGAGAPPGTWPVLEHRVDLLHKSVYAAVTGWLSDRMVAERPRPLPGRHSH
jgi:hypothetical protein